MTIEFTWNEIINTKNKNWIVANDNVYDITELLDKHPGGKNCLIKHLKQDCTLDYNFHSKNGKKEWNKYKIGIIKTEKCCIIL